VANDTHFAKDFSNPDKNSGVIGRNSSLVRGEIIAEIGK
jgi:hypothetical protein